MIEAVVLPTHPQDRLLAQACQILIIADSRIPADLLVRGRDILEFMDSHAEQWTAI